MWLKLSDSMYYFGSGAVNRCEPVDRRGKPDFYVYMTELYCSNVRVGLVKETIEEIYDILQNKKSQQAERITTTNRGNQDNGTTITGIGTECIKGNIGEHSCFCTNCIDLGNLQEGQ